MSIQKLKQVRLINGKFVNEDLSICINGDYFYKNENTNSKSGYPEAIYYRKEWIVRTSDYEIPNDSSVWCKKEDLLCLVVAQKDWNRGGIKSPFKLKSFTYKYSDHMYDEHGQDFYLFKPFNKYKKYKQCYILNEEVGLLLDLEWSFKENRLVKSNKALKKINQDYVSKVSHINPYKRKCFYIDKSRLSFRDKMEIGEETLTYLISEGHKYTFGVEIETSSGFVHPVEYFTNLLNISCDHDGSIDGGEYVTRVLKGDSGFKHLHKILSFLRTRCKINNKCGIHVHIGGAIFNKSFSVYSYILGEKLQNDLFRMLPSSRRHNKYCADLPDFELDAYIKEYGYKYGIDLAYEYLYRQLSSGSEIGPNSNKKHNHPYGRYCGQYHDVDFETILRYKWLNLVPCNFNVRGFDFFHARKELSKARTDLPFTIEFRNHSASLNYTKIKNWVLICMAFVYYVENCKEDIISKNFITVEDIIKKAYNKKADYLLEYVKKRKELFKDFSNDTELNVITENSVNINFNQLLCV